MPAPISLFCYRRLDCLKQTVESLKKNKEIKDSILFIFSDGYKNNDDKKGVEEVREYIKTIDGFKKIEIIEAKENKGLANSIIDGVTKVINEYGKTIVLEDDIYVSPYFLKYMNDALDTYKDEDKVASIVGYVQDIDNLPESFFLKKGHCWGWATWKRAWDLFEPDGVKLLKELKRGHKDREFDLNDTYIMTEILRYQIAKRNDSWAVRWFASCFLNDKLFLYLGKPVSVNIGFGILGSTHCTLEKDNELEKKLLNPNPVKVVKIEPKENKACRRKFEQYFKKLHIDPYTKGNFLFKKERNGNKRKITILGLIKFRYEAYDEVSKEIENK